MAGKRFLGKVSSRLCRYSLGQKFRQNGSISHPFRDKCVFVFYAEIPRWWRESNFWEMLPVDTTDNLWVKTFVEIVPSLTISEILKILHFQ